MWVARLCLSHIDVKLCLLERFGYHFGIVCLFKIGCEQTMERDKNEPTREEISQQLQELETNYAEAFINNADTASLTIIWDKIKGLRNKLDDQNRLNKERIDRS
jgi:hypothetical protein